MKTIHQKRKSVKSNRSYTKASNSKDNSLLLRMANIAKLSQLHAHEQGTFVKENLLKNPHEEHKLSYYANKGTELVVLLLEGTLYISFRGTEMDSTDIVPHAVRCSKKTKLGNIHKGYWLKFVQVSYYLHRQIKAYHNTPVVFVGHSLGGALAQIAYLWAKKTFAHLDASCYTFGSCKPIKNAPKEQYKNIFNYYLAKDYVGLFPFGYYSLTEPIIINSNNKYKTETFPMWNVAKALSSIFVTKRHGIDNYIKTFKVLT